MIIANNLLLPILQIFSHDNSLAKVTIKSLSTKQKEKKSRNNAKQTAAYY
jgi:hypothetical protein